MNWSQQCLNDNIAKHAFRCSAPAVWNSLPQTVLSSDSVAVFNDIPLFPGFLFFLCSLTCCLAPAPLKIRPYGTIQICLLLLLLFLLRFCRKVCLKIVLRSSVNLPRIADTLIKLSAERTFSVMVAEKSIVCLLCEHRRTTSFICSRKNSSNILPATHNTGYMQLATAADVSCYHQP